MISSFRRLISRAPDVVPPSVPEGERVYAVGDIHGRLDLFELLIARIEADDAARVPARTTVVLLGDLVDRGPDSFGVIERAIAWRLRRAVRVIAGNHEEMMLGSFERDDVLRNFLLHGGRETVLSYPIDHDVYQCTTLTELRALLPGIVPAHHLAFLGLMEEHVRIGDYLFVHAGIRPGVALEDQRGADLRWIRGEFLNDRRDHGMMVVHGHSITEGIDIRTNRIGLDTGAYFSGRLTAIGLEGTERWFLSAEIAGEDDNRFED